MATTALNCLALPSKFRSLTINNTCYTSSSDQFNSNALLLTPSPSKNLNMNMNMNSHHQYHHGVRIGRTQTQTQLSANSYKQNYSSVKTAVAAVDSDQQLSSTTTTTTTDSAAQQVQANGKYYFVVANAKFMLDEEEHFKELLFERLRYYGERSKEQDFWLVIEPKFLDKFPDITKRLGRPAVALVSTNGPWITFMKLRLDRVLAESYEANSLEEALSSNPVNIEFQKPGNWVAPYPKYESGWWEAFLPPGSAKPKV